MNEDAQFASLAFPLQPPHDSDSHSSYTNTCNHVFVTLILATDVASNLRRIPAGFHAIVEVDGMVIQTSNKPVSTGKDAVEWDEEFLLPSNQSCWISFSVYASFEVGPRLGNGELLRRFRITVGEIIHHRNGQLQLTDFTVQEGDVLPSCSFLSIITERRICGTNKYCLRLDLPESREANALERFTDEGHRALLRYSQQEDQMDLDTAIQTFEHVREICPIDHPNRSAVLFNFANARFIDCQANNRYLDLDGSIELYRDALRLRNKNHPDHCATALELGLALLARFQKRGSELDKGEATALLAGVVDATAAESYAHRAGLFVLRMADASVPVDVGDAGSSQAEQANGNNIIHETWDALQNIPCWNPRRAALLASHALQLSYRFDRNGVLTDIHEAISMFESAVDLTPHTHPDMPSFLDALGSALLRRFNHVGDLADINKSISTFEEAVCLTPDGHPDKPAWLSNLGSALVGRFEFVGDLADLNSSISMREKAVCLTPDGHPRKPALLNNLGNSLLSHFERLGDLGNLNRFILMFEKADHLTPDGHPNKPALLCNLGNSLLDRFKRFGNLVDLIKSISKQEKAICLTPGGHPDKPLLLDNLGSSLLSRFERQADPADINRSISMFEEAVSLTSNGHPEKPHRLSRLGNSLLSRFDRLGDLADLNKSISMKEEAVCLMPDGHPHKPDQLNDLGTSLSRRFERLGDLADLNRAISMTEEAVSLSADNHPDKLARVNNLGNSLLSRFERLGDPTDLKKSISMFEEALSLLPKNHPDQPMLLNNLGNSLSHRFERLGNFGDLNKSISMKEEAVYLTPHDHPLKPTWLNNLGISLKNRFECLGDHADIVKYISVQQEAIRFTPDGHPDKPSFLISLGDTFKIRFRHSQDSSHLSAAASNFSIASRTSIGRTSTRFRAARSWISCAQLQGNTTALLDACTSALNLLPELAWLGLPVTERHRLLVEAADVTHESVASALEAGHPELAVEWLEQGRSIVWSQFLQLRTPVDDLAHKHPALARQLRQISQELERASVRDNPAFYQPTNIPIADTRLLEKDIQRHHDLALRREKLLLQIRSFPGFDRFLLSKTIKQLASLAISGPVVYLTASKERCDALIVMAELEHVIHVPLPGIRYDHVESIRKKLRVMLERHSLILSRDTLHETVSSEDIDISKFFLDLSLGGGFDDGSDQAAETKLERLGGPAKTKPQRFEEYTPNEFYQVILKLLWNDVVSPVLHALGFSSPPSATDKMTRIFWCPTGPFSFLPIHAAGLYDAPEADTKLSDFIISSYLPTLSSLTSSPQNSLGDPSSKLRLLAVPQPSTDGFSKLIGVKHEINSIRDLSNQSGFVTFQSSDGSVEDVVQKLKNNDWVHFACHGVQDPKTPLDSGLCLANKHRLRLVDIIQLSRPKGGLAFLSACQTTQGNEMLSEESVHLAAGMLLAGYGSVIGTMWSIMDNDAPDVARDVYEHLFRNGGRVPDSTEAAAALHCAVQRLRESGASFTSWVPFIHFGR